MKLWMPPERLGTVVSRKMLALTALPFTEENAAGLLTSGLSHIWA